MRFLILIEDTEDGLVNVCMAEFGNPDEQQTPAMRLRANLHMRIETLLEPQTQKLSQERPS